MCVAVEGKGLFVSTLSYMSTDTDSLCGGRMEWH